MMQPFVELFIIVGSATIGGIIVGTQSRSGGWRLFGALIGGIVGAIFVHITRA